MRSTSGITCCHFFCSAVFSMPVCRKPIVAFAETIVSPESSTTMFSTPCVLGCWGPMLTVIVSWRSSGMLNSAAERRKTEDGRREVRFSQVLFDYFSNHVQQRAMDFLHVICEIIEE